VDNAGYVFLVDRLKARINSAAFKITGWSWSASCAMPRGQLLKGRAYNREA
jgi:hypothetical protein